MHEVVPPGAPARGPLGFAGRVVGARPLRAPAAAVPGLGYALLPAPRGRDVRDGERSRLFRQAKPGGTGASGELCGRWLAAGWDCGWPTAGQLRGCCLAFGRLSGCKGFKLVNVQTFKELNQRLHVRRLKVVPSFHTSKR